MAYRNANQQDIDGLRALALASYGRLKPQLTEKNWEKMKTVLSVEETFPDLVRYCHAFVYEEEGQLLGMAFLVPSGNPTKIYSKETSYIRMVGVHPDAGGKGIAQHLTTLCIDKARELGETTISLHSAELMHAARHIYEKLGFLKIRLLDEHYGLKYWLYQLHL